jgi:hypothetical protein
MPAARSSPASEARLPRGRGLGSERPATIAAKIAAAAAGKSEAIPNRESRLGATHPFDRNQAAPFPTGHVRSSGKWGQAAVKRK